MNKNSRFIATILVLFTLVLCSPAVINISLTARQQHNYAFSIKSDTNNISALSSSNQSLRFDNFAGNYFYNLLNYKNNNNNSCGYIAIQMLLSFYNYYWNNDLIQDQYKTKATQNYSTNSLSPGTIDSFYDKIVEIGSALGYGLELPSVNSINEIISKYLEITFGDDADRWFVFGYYNYNKTATHPDTNLTNSAYFASEIRKLVLNNTPVIIIIDDYDDQGRPAQHACIAYGYDSNSQRLLLNTGWGLYHDTSTLEREDDCIVGYISLLPKNIAHTHSSNFMKDGEYVCSCKLSDHSHKYTYSSVDTINHNCLCFCEYTCSQKHSFRETPRKYICTYCGFTKPNTGEITPPILPDYDLDDIEHQDYYSPNYILEG